MRNGMRVEFLSILNKGGGSLFRIRVCLVRGELIYDILPIEELEQ